MTNPQLSHQRNWMNWNRENRLVWAADYGREPDDVKTQRAPWVRNAIVNNLNGLRQKLNGAQEGGEKKDLAERVTKGGVYLDRLRTFLDSPERMDSAMAEWDRLNTLLQRFEAPGAKFGALMDVLDTELEVFLDADTVSKAMLARAAVTGGARIESLIKQPTMASLVSTAEGKWGESQNLLKSQAGKLTDPEARDFYLEAAANTTPKDRGTWIRKNIKKFETEKFSVKELSDKIPNDALESIKNIVQEAKMILQEQLAVRLEKRVDAVETRAEAYLKKWESELNPNTRDEIRANLEAARKTVDSKIRSFDSDGLSPSEALVSLNGLVSAFEAQAEKSIRGIENQDWKLSQLSQNRESVVKGVARKEAKLLNLAEKGKNPEARRAMGATLEKALMRANPDDTIAKGQLEMDRKLLKQFESDKEIKTLSDLTSLRGEELVARAQEVGEVANKLEGAEKADLAKRAMVAIQFADNAKEALSTLSETVGSEHVEYVTSKIFEAKYRRYTTEGFMVFAIKGEDWRVIVDEGKVKNEKNGNLVGDLKEQLTHELRHLEFEGDTGLNESWKNAFTRMLSQEEWQGVKASFVNRFPGKTPSDYKGNKTRFEASDWPNADVLSELYAMAPDWSFMPDSVAAIAHKGEKMADFQRNDKPRSDWENAFLGDENREKWLKVRDAIERSFPHRTDASGTPLSQWSDSKVLAELYAMPLSQIEGATELMAALSGAGIFGWLYGKNSKAKSYEESAEERILGSEHGHGGGGHGKNEKEGVVEALPMSKDGLKKSLGGFLEKIKAYEKSPYIDHVVGGRALLGGMKNAANTAMGKLDAYEHGGRLESIGKLVAKLEDDLEGEGESVKSEVRAKSEEMKNPEKNPLRAFWNNTHIYSIHAFIDVYGHAKDYFERWQKKNHGIHKGNLSKQLFDGVNEGLALESSSFISGAWKEAIGGWEEKLKSKNTSKLKDYLSEQAELAAPDKAIVCAVINIMSDKGIMDWVNEDLWTCLNKLQTETRFEHPEDKLLYSDKNYLREKLKIAFASAPVFNKAAAFNEKDKLNTSKYESNKNEYKSVIASTPALVGTRLKKLLLKARGELHHGEYHGSKDIDPAEYEELLDLSIENGFSSPETIIFYLMSGMACGLLQPGTGGRLAKHFGVYPIMDYFNDMASQMGTTGDVRELVRSKFNKEYQACEHGGRGSEFMRFYWTEVANNPRVLTRMTQKVESGGQNWDHDWSRAFAMCGNASIAKTILKGPSSSPTTKLTQPPNIYLGLLQWFEENSSEGVHTSRELMAQRIGYYFAFESILSGAAYSTDKSYRRKTDLAMNEPPHDAGSSSHPKMSVLEIEGKLNGMMGSISPTLGKLLELAIDKESAEPPNDVAHLQKIKELLSGSSFASKLTKLDDFYNNIGQIVAELLKSVPESSMVAGIRRGVG